jgi:hypothetical protein
MKGLQKSGSRALPYVAAAAVLIMAAWLDQRMAYRGQVRGETLSASGYLWTGALVSFATSGLIVLLTIATFRCWRGSRRVLFTYLFVGATLTCFSPLAASDIPGLSEFLALPGFQPIREPLARMGPRSVLGVAAAAVALIGLLGLLWPKRVNT